MRALAALALLPGLLVADAGVFVSDRNVALRESPGPLGRVVARVPIGTAAVLLSREGTWLRLEVPSLGRSGWVSSGAAALFDDGPRASREMAVVGRFLASDPARRPLAAALLLAATERLRRGGEPDALAEVVLGETAEALASAGAAPPEGIAFATRFDPSEGAVVDVYPGDAFRAALDSLACDAPAADDDVRDRARAGVLRARFPFPSTTLGTLLEETTAWLELVESASSDRARSVGAARLAEAAPRLARLLLAASRQADLERLSTRLQELAAGRPRLGPSLASCLEVIGAMRGDGTAPFPQTSVAAFGPLPQAVAIVGEIGALGLRVTPASPTAAPRLLPGPVLPVPGSLRLSPDGRSATWLEVAGPTRVVPAFLALDGDPAAPPDTALLAGGRLARDRGRKHVVASRVGYAADGSRVAFSVRAWDDVPPADGRIAVVSVRTGELVLDGTASDASRARYREAMNVPAPRSTRRARSGP